MTPAQLSRTVLHTVRRAVEDDELCVAVPERVTVRTPPRPGCGDYATNVALQLARARGDALVIAEVLRRRLVRTPGIARVDVAAPGFLNITLEAASHTQLVQAVLSQGPDYGRGDALAGVCVPVGTSVGTSEVRAALVAHVVRGLVAACGGVVVAGDGPVVRPSPLSGRDLLTRLGPDAARWALLRPAAHDLPDTAPARLLSQREDNPLFRVRYAHARVRGLMRNARRLGITSAPGVYDHPAEAALLALLADHPRTLEAAARHRAPDRLARHLVATADAFFPFQDLLGDLFRDPARDRFHDVCPPPPSGERKPSAVHRSRLALAEAVGAVLAGGLHLLGISAPRHL
ncbi:DALR anticodon-binding domain-containing protein [Streptomyces sp. SRF1]|uniref:ArgS-related anticodon-binding protein NrtL n=1 Tax=Streptomyces sp. SRF1 TaxID=1549642 RepID=UPI0025B105F3|nr:DALR anticodon-binding domain-containing protein [Streptomyces sp. SRF1]MDN3053489.1 DALR anticodon-binding domain-containing protein [Streptomyces sp. SRF1]